MTNDYNAQKNPVYCMDVDEFFRGGEPCSLSTDVRRLLEQERNVQGPLDLDSLRRGQDQSELSDLIVGQEGKGHPTFY